MVDFMFALIELFSLCLLCFRSYEAKCVQLGCIHRKVDLFALKLYIDKVVTINHSWHQNLCIPSF